MTELMENACTASQRRLSKSDSFHISLGQLVMINLKELDDFKELPQDKKKRNRHMDKCSLRPTLCCSGFSNKVMLCSFIR